jgi:DNA primase
MMVDNNANAATQAKKRWNAKNYTQVKAHIDPEVASAFKAACAASGTSMAAAITQFMSEYSRSAKKHTSAPDYSTRRKRRAAVSLFAQELENIKDAEELCRDNTPENLQGSVVYETADEYVSLLEEAVELLSAIY